MASDQQRLGLPSAMVGFLSSKGRLTSGDSYQAPANARLLIEPEVAIQIDSNLPADASADEANSTIVAYTAALELIDTTRSVDDDIEEILAGNMFHERVVLSEQHIPSNTFNREQLNLSLSINNKEVRTLEQQRVPQDFSEIIITVANTLAAHGE